MKTVIIIPCYNEGKILEENIKKILSVVRGLSYDIRIVISNNNSDDRTAEIGKKLAHQNEVIDYVFVGTPGKGAAVIDAWQKYNVDVYGFMDADLATNLGALKPALDRIVKSHNIVIGSRRISGAKVKRELYRKFTSLVLNLLIRVFLKTKIRDTACGFKFFRHNVIKNILPQVRDRAWTFDTECLILAEKFGFQIKEIPVEWEEKGARGSRVVPVPTIIGYLKKIIELRKRIQEVKINC